MTAQDTLVIALEAAVPLHIIDLRDRTPEQRVAIAQRSANEVGSKGDILQYGGGRRGRGLAAGAYAPGGITFAGQHWCVDHAICTGAEAQTTPTPAVTEPRWPRPIVDLELPA